MTDIVVQPISVNGSTEESHDAEARWPASSALLLTVTEAAGQLRVSRTEMWRIIGRRQVAVVKIGRLTRIRPDALRDFVRRLEHAPQPER